MSNKINSKAVLKYLNELGYSNITPEQLKEFMKDLKKLIKYEERKETQKDQENLPPSPPCTPRCPTPPVSLASQKTKTTIEDCPKTPAQNLSEQCRQNIIRITVKHPRKECDCADKTCKHTSKSTQVSEPIKKQTVKRPNVTEGSKNVSKTLYIHPRKPVKLNRSDPVALYHKYQQQWNKHKIPGEASHLDVRWTVREKLLGEPSVPKAMSAAPSMEAIAKERKNCRV